MRQDKCARISVPASVCQLQCEDKCASLIVPGTACQLKRVHFNALKSVRQAQLAGFSMPASVCHTHHARASVTPSTHRAQGARRNMPGYVCQLQRIRPHARVGGLDVPHVTSYLQVLEGPLRTIEACTLLWLVVVCSRRTWLLHHRPNGAELARGANKALVDTRHYRK